MHRFGVVGILGFTLSIALTTGCLDEGADTGAEALALASDQLRFEVTLPAGQQYVELFVRQNGVQNVATAIQGSAVANGDGTATYSLVRGGYAAGDVVEYRFYSYLPGAPGVFTPGPAEQAWTTLDVGGPIVTEVPVAKDAAVIYASLGTGPAAGRNFGAAASVDIGEYHLTSEGLFGYSLAGIPTDATVTSAEWVIPSAYSPAGPVVHFRLNRVTSAWAESTVTWNSKPAYAPLREIAITSGAVNRIDVTAEVAAALASGELSLALQPSIAQPSVDNVFIDAREKVGGAATSLVVTWTR